MLENQRGMLLLTSSTNRPPAGPSTRKPECASYICPRFLSVDEPGDLENMRADHGIEGRFR